MKYSIEIQHESGWTDAIVLAAKTDSSAVTQMRKQLPSLRKQYPAANLYLAFDRASDVQHGYINRDGANPIGEPW